LIGFMKISYVDHIINLLQMYLNIVLYENSIVES